MTKTKLRFAHTFSNGAVGTISVDPRQLRENGLYAIAPCIIGKAPAPFDECESWMREVVFEVVGRIGKEARAAGPSGVMWSVRPGQGPECLGTCLPKGFMAAFFAAEAMRRNRNGGSAQ